MMLSCFEKIKRKIKVLVKGGREIPAVYKKKKKECCGCTAHCAILSERGYFYGPRDEGLNILGVKVNALQLLPVY